GGTWRQRSLDDSFAQEVFHAVPLLVQLLQRGVDALAAELRDLDALDDLVAAAAGADRIAEDHAFGNAIAAVGRDAHGHPVAVAAAVDPVAHVVDRRVGGAGGGGEAARVDDRRAALLHRGNERRFEPGLSVDHRPDLLATGLRLEDVGVLGRRVIAPHGDFADFIDLPAH